MEDKKTVEFVNFETLNKLSDQNSYDEFQRKNQERGTVHIFVNDGVKAMLRDLIKKLSEIEQEVVHLKFWDDLSLGEIARQLKICESEVTAILSSALEKIKDQIQNIYKYNNRPMFLPGGLYA